MNYKKIETTSYNLHLINTNKFKTIQLRISFRALAEKNKIVYRNMISNILMDSTKKYPTRRLIEIASEELYNTRFWSDSYLSGNYHILNFSTAFLNEKYTEKGMTEKSLQFLLDFILDPYIIDNKFDEVAFNKAKHALKTDILSSEDNPRSYSDMRLAEEMFNDTPLEYRGVGYIEDLDNIDTSNLLEYYHSIIKNDLVDIFIVGNIENVNIEEIIAKNFNLGERNTPRIPHSIYTKVLKEEPTMIKEVKNYKQSCLEIGYKNDELTEFERQYVFTMYNFILGGSPDSKLFKNVREKNSLCYTVNSSFNPISNSSKIYAGINAENFEKAKEVINEQFESMRNGGISDKDLEKAITNHKASLKEIEDNPSSILNLYQTHEYVNTALLEERKENIVKVTKEMIATLANKISIDTIFFLEGGKK